MNLISLATVEWFTLGIYECHRGLRADANHFHYHRRSDTPSKKEEGCPSIQKADVILKEQVAAANEWIEPCTVRVEETFLEAALEQHRRCRGISDRSVL